MVTASSSNLLSATMTCCYGTSSATLQLHRHQKLQTVESVFHIHRCCCSLLCLQPND